MQTLCDIAGSLVLTFYQSSKCSRQLLHFCWFSAATGVGGFCSQLTFHGLDDLKLLRQEGLEDAGAEGELRQVGERGEHAAHRRAAAADLPVCLRPRQRLQLLLTLRLKELALAQEVLSAQRQAVERFGQVVSSWTAGLTQSHLLPANTGTFIELTRFKLSFKGRKEDNIPLNGLEGLCSHH